MAFRYQGPIPASAVLVGKANHSTGVVAGGTARLGEQYKGQEADGLWLVGHQFDESSPEPDGFARQVDSGQTLPRGGGVTLGVDQVNGGEHGPKSVGQLSSSGYAVEGVVVAQFALGPDDPLRHRRLGHEERPGHLVRLKAREEPEGESDLRIDAEGRMCAEEHQPKLVVGNDINEVVEPVKFGIVVRVHAVGVESKGREMALARALIRVGGGRQPGCGRSW